MSEIINVPEERTIYMVTVEIKTLQKQAQQVVLGYAIEIGRRLTEAKGMLPHGAWGPWLRDEVNYSKSTANNFMRIFDEYGADQMGLFGPEAKSQTLGNLPYTKALRLLAIPEEEREEFVEANNVEDLSTRELDRLIKERDEARAAEAAAVAREQEARELAEAAATAQETLQKGFAAEKETMQDRCRTLNELAEKQKAAAEEAAARAEKAEAAAKKARENLKKLKDNPEIPEDTMEKIRAEAEETARKTEAEKTEKQLAKAKNDAQEAARAAKEALERAEAAEKARAEAEKRLSLANADLVLLNAELERLQECFNRCHGLLMKVEANSPDMAAKLKAALPQLLDSMKARV